MISVAPAAVWYAGSVCVSSGFKILNFGRITSEPAPLLNMPSSFVITESGLPSLPAAAIVRTVPTGRAFSIFFP